MDGFTLSLITQEKKYFEGEVSGLVLPGKDGYFGVLAQHAPLISILGEGTVTLEKGEQKYEFTITGGFFEISDNKASILADSLSGYNFEIS